MNIKNTSKKNKPSITNKKKFIVGIGASAGGLKAISELLSNLPTQTGMGFVVVQHMDPTHESMTVDIFSRLTSLKVLEVKDGMTVKPDHVYVIPPNRAMKILHGVLKLLPRPKTRGLHLPIDFFFQSLAKDQASKSIGVILSGTATDGTSGLKAIKAAGGLTIAQAPTSAEYDGMPSNAIASGIVDLILPPKDIAIELIRITQHPLLARQALSLDLSSHPLTKNDEEALSKILMILRTKCHVDFSHYKRSTLKRRIKRRVILQKKENLSDYLEYLQANTDEAKFLFADILINVTEFFRDTNCFLGLKQKIFPEIIKEKSTNSTIRIWVVGCATGEEAYSVAMSLLEHAGGSLSNKKIQIFATDISDTAIQHARAGVYPASINETFSKKRLQKFFEKTMTGDYRIHQSIREMCLFSWHDITKDPPFAKLDLICCRNLLIYFDSVLQKRILSVFHYALNPGGFLWLGSSESVGQLPMLFSLIDKKNKFYSRKPAPAAAKFPFPINNYIPEKLGSIKKFSEQIKNPSDIQRETDRVASSIYAPPGVVVNNEMEIVLIRGETAPYLQLSPGHASFNLFKMTRTEIVSDLRMIIQTAKKKNVHIKKTGLTIGNGKHLIKFNLDVIPLTMPPPIKERYFLISFESSAVGEMRKHVTNPHHKEVAEELTEVKTYQQDLIRDYDAAQEELTTTNEELQSTNEELQSTNEELETATEELQSINEELTTLNDELQNRNSDLAQLNNDLVNLIGCIDIPVVMVGIDRCIRRFTPKAGKIMNLLPSDVGRPINDFKPNIDIPDIEHLVLEVIETITKKELDVQDREGKWFQLRISPYKTTDNRIDGAVISLIDINILKRTSTENKSSLDYAISIANTVQLPLVVLDKQLRLESANNPFYEKFRITPKNNKADFLSLISDKIESATSLRKALSEVFVSNKKLENFEMKYTFPSTEYYLLLNAQQIHWIDRDEPNALLLSILDITESHNLQIKLTDALAMADRVNQTKDLFLATLSHELRTPLTPILSWAQFLQMKDGSTKLKHGLKIIEQSAIAQIQLIEDLLDISRIQSGKLALNISKLDAAEIIHLAVESVRSLAEKKSITIATHIIPLKEKVAADPSRLQQIIWNLLTNAIKFSSPKGVVDVYLTSLEKEGRKFVSIKIIDYGKGINPDFLPQIFERFTQADIDTTRVHGGLGIGLSIVHDLLKLLGGTILAESEGEGKGATFTILLPLISNGIKQKEKVPEVISHDIADAAEEQADLRQKLSGLTVLVVEDEQNSLDAIAELLKSAGIIAIPTNSVAKAWAALDKYKPDILISDIAMPEEDGYSLIKKIRAREAEQGGRIPAVALTAYGTKKDIKQALSAGFDAHLIKPFNVIDLFRILATTGKHKR